MQVTLAAADLLADKNADADGWITKIKAVNPGYGKGYVSVARHLVLNRRYTEGVAYYRGKRWKRPDSVGSAFRVGDQPDAAGSREHEPRRQLELAYNNGQTDAATSNSLRLLDS